MGKTRIDENKEPNMSSEILTSGLVCELQDRLMSYAKRFGFPATMVITEQDYVKKNNTLVLSMYEYEYDWEVMKWGPNGKERFQSIPMNGPSMNDFHNFYWTLELAGVTIASSMRYSTLDAAIEDASTWEEIEINN